jgi:hypothetical protein
MSALPHFPEVAGPAQKVREVTSRLMQCNKTVKGADVAPLKGQSGRSALALLRLMTNANLVGCSKGRSARLAPLSAD